MKFILGAFLVLAFLAIPVLAETISTKEIYKVEVRELLINPNDLECKESVTAIVNVQNKGNIDAAISAELVNNELGVDAFSPTIKIQAGRQQGIGIPFTIDKESRGAYEFEIRLYTDEGIQRLFQTVHFDGCSKPKFTSLIREFKQPKEKTEVSIEEIEEPLPLGVIVTISLFGILAGLSMLFIVTAYVQNQPPK